MKNAALLNLARLRQSMRLDGYACIGDFHDGIFECDHVSPFTKSGNNIDAEIMVVGQDWTSADKLGSNPPNLQSAKLGYTPGLPTNKNLDDLLKRHLGLTRSDCYLTNLFPFLKHGNKSANIPPKHLVNCARQFTFPEIQIVSPKHVICLGIAVYTALRSAAGKKEAIKLDQAAKSPFRFEQSMIHCVAHPANRGGRKKIDEGWQRIAVSFESSR